MSAVCKFTDSDLDPTDLDGGAPIRRRAAGTHYAGRDVQPLSFTLLGGSDKSSAGFGIRAGPDIGQTPNVQGPGFSAARFSFQFGANVGLACNLFLDPAGTRTLISILRPPLYLAPPGV